MNENRKHILKYFVFALIVAVTLLAGVTSARAAVADPLGVDFSGTTTVGTKADFGSDINIIGWQFAVNRDITIDRLGYFDYLGTTMTGTHDVALYDSTGARLASANVSTADPLAGNGSFRFHGISALTLMAGQSYVIAATVGNDFYTFEPNNLVWNSGITFLQDVFDSGNTNLPAGWTSTESAGINGGFGPNFAAAVPIPPAVYMLAPAFLGLIGVRKRIAG